MTKLGGSRSIFLVFHEESEPEVQNIQILQENLKNSISIFQNISLNPIKGLVPLQGAQGGMMGRRDDDTMAQLRPSLTYSSLRRLPGRPPSLGSPLAPRAEMWGTGAVSLKAFNWL